MKKKLLSVLSAFIVTGSLLASSAYANPQSDTALSTGIVQNPVHDLANVTTPPASVDGGVVQPRGASAPGSSASTQNLSISAYNYQVTKIGARVYTDKWLTGASNMKVTVNNWTILTQPTSNNVNNEVTVTLVDSSGTEVSKTITFNLSIGNYSGQASFTGLSSSKKYYVRFSVPTNDNTYSFDGQIIGY